MGHPTIDNLTPFVFETIFLNDEEGRPICVSLVKGTFRIRADGRCLVAEEQIPVNFSGESWGEDPATSSYRYEPEVALFKPSTDVILNAQAHAPTPATTVMTVTVQVGDLRKELLAIGDRIWFKSRGVAGMSAPLRFETMPIVYERAFGGWDRSSGDVEGHTCELRNPVGVGFARKLTDGLRLPNIEDPKAPIREVSHHPAPAGFGFVSPNWQPRAALAGTYDQSWRERRAPLLPADFDRRYYNSASPGLVAAGYLRGDESVAALGLTPSQNLSCELPGIPPPNIRIVQKRLRDVTLKTDLDTVIIEPDNSRVLLSWRAQLKLPHGPHALETVEVSMS